MSTGFRFLIILGLAAAVSCAVHEEPNRQGKFGFFKGATSMLSSLAQDLVMRSGTSSQAIVFGAGSFGYGYGTGNYGRSVDVAGNEVNSTEKAVDWSHFLSEFEILMMLGFMKGDVTKDYGCLQRIVCQEPRRAEEYSFTGKLFLKGYEVLGGSANVSRYQEALAHIDEAIVQGLSGRNCLGNYRCEVS